MGKIGLAFVVLLAGFAVATSSASAYVYWAAYDSGNSTIARADLDGSNVNASLVRSIYFGAGVASDGTFVYWGESGSNPRMGAVGRATIDGAFADHAFQPGGTFCGVFDVVATASDLIWLKSTCSGIPDRAINRVGKGGNQGGASTPVSANGICGFAVDGTYVYWSEANYIGRVPLAGGAPDHRWLDTGASTQPCAVAVDAGHVYWTTLAGSPTFRGGSIGRASISGDPGSVQPSFISGTSFTNVNGIAVAGNRLYWTNAGAVGVLAGSVARANADGTGVEQAWIPNVFNPGAIAIDPLGPGGAGSGSGGGGGGGGGRRSATPPRLTHVGLSHRSFVVLRGFRRPSRPHPPTETTFTFTLDKPAEVVITIVRVRGGRLVRGICVKRKRRNARRPTCNLPVETDTLIGRAGVNRMSFTGRHFQFALPPGRYRATFVARAGGLASKPIAVGFRIARG